MASLGGEQKMSSNSPAGDVTKQPESREGSVERNAAAKERDDKLKVARERQNEERQRKIEELKAQAEAAQRYREQKEEERRRRIEEIRHRDSEKRLQVEERKKAIMEAEKERREYILRKNQERETRLELKKRERNSYGYAFGSSTPRLLEPADFGMVSPSTFWGQRRSTSISNVAGASLSRRSSERELNDSGTKKRATSASGTERHDDHRRKSSSMYEVFHWNDEPPKRFSLSIVSSEINIDGPPSSTLTATAANVIINKNSNNNCSNTNNSRNTSTEHHHKQYSNHNFYTTSSATASATTSTISKEDNVDTSHIVFRSVARRKTDLMPTIPSPRDGHYGSRSSLSTPRTPGRAYSMNRLDQLAQPIRRNGEHIRAILERERREQMEMLDETESISSGHQRSAAAKKTGRGANSSISRSMTHLAGGGAQQRPKYNLGGGISTSFLPLGSGSRVACKSMIHLGNAWSTSTSPRSNLGLQTAATKKYLQSSLASPTSNTTKRGQLHFSTTNPYRYDTDSLLLMNSPSLLLNPGSRSGNVTPGGQLTSRPGSSMSTSTTMSTSGFITRRSMPATRKPRPSSIAGTGVSLEEINKLKKESKPPMKTITPSTSAQTTPKRSTNMMSTSLIVTSSSRLSSAEKKTPNKRDSATPKATTPKPLSTTSSTDRLHKINREKPKDLTTSMTRSAIMSAPANKTVPKDNKEPLTKSKEEKEALNQVKTEVLSNNHNTDTIKSSAQKNGAKERKMSGATAQEEEKIDQGTEKESDAIVREKPKSHNSSKEGSLVREFGGGDSHDSMTASMIAKSKITTEEEAKAALAERRRWAREEAEKHAELERQRLEAERLAEIKRQEEETERQRQFEEEATRLAEEQREAEEERLRQAIEEAKHREEEEKRKREEDEKQRLEREESEKKAKEEAEKQRLVVAERLKREEKEREERRKRVEAIMSRTRRSGNNSTPSSTPSKENNNIMKTTVVTPNAATITPQENQEQLTPIHNTTSATTITSISVNSDSNSTSGSSSATATTPTAINNTVALPVMPASTEQNAEEIKSQFEPQNSQAMYEQSVIDKENSLINSFSNLIIDENAKNIHQQPQQQQQQRIHHQFVVEEKNAKKLVELQNNETKNILTTNAVANGNGHHIDSINNKNEIDLIQNVVPTANQLINLSLDTQDNVNFNNNNSLLTTTTTALVTADSHENKDISLL
uniref:MAP7 domain-containing protein n=1 Tax=Glossina pallidipes TaxID=7398 RepID=A0A1B0A6U5_GLOPL